MRVTIIVFILSIIQHSYSQIESFDGLKPINGTRLHLKIIAQPFKAKSGKGEPLLVVHGGPGFGHAYFMPHLKSLSKWFTLILFDQRAAGRSAIPTSDSLSLKYFVDDIEGIRKSLGIEKVLLLGHSWGAIPVTQYALDYPDRVKGIIFSNPVALSREFDSMTKEAQLKKASSRDSTNRSLIIGSPDFKAGKADAYQRLMLVSFQHSFADENNLGKLNLVLRSDYKTASQALFAGLGNDMANYNYYESVPRFKFPVLIQHGREDILPLQASEKLLESIPNSRLTIYRNSGHFIFIEENKKFTQEVIAFSRMVNESLK